MTLTQRLKIAQELIFQATVRGNKNWIRFIKNSSFHLMIGRGEIDGVNLKDVREVDDMMEISTHI